MELPQYTLHHTIKRMVVPRLILLIIMTPAFYFGIWVNAKLLGIAIPPVISVFIFLILVVMVSVQSILNYVRFQKFRYLFYTNRIDYEGKKPQTFLYTNFTEAKLKQNMFDKMFNTGSVQLDKTFSIGPISNVTQIKAYLEQLVQYYKFTQQRFRIQQQQQQMKSATQSTSGASKNLGSSPSTTTQTGEGVSASQSGTQGGNL